MIGGYAAQTDIAPRPSSPYNTNGVRNLRAIRRAEPKESSDMDIDIRAIEIDMALLKRLLLEGSEQEAKDYIFECVEAARLVDDDERSNGRPLR